MFYAIDSNRNMADVDSCSKQTQHFCPVCKQPVIQKIGEERAHHFAHMKECPCIDNWQHEMEEWHLQWQKHFSPSCCETPLEFNGEKHFADVFIKDKKTVIEFQAEPIKKKEFDERNDFFTKQGLRVIWLFNEIANYELGNIDCENKNNYFWKRPRLILKDFDLTNPNIHIFLQILPDTSNELGRIIHPISTETNFKTFKTKDPIHPFEFLQFFYKNLKEPNIIDSKLLCDELSFSHSKDHTSFYLGCPISESGICGDSDIDCPSIQNPTQPFCQLCKYKGPREGTCSKRIMDLNLPSSTVFVSVKKDFDGDISDVTYVENGEKKTAHLKPLPKKPVGKTIFELWDAKKPSVAIFKDLNSEFFVKVTSNPSEQKRKYKRCYGVFSKSQYSYTAESKEIYGADSSKWELVWCKY